MMTFRPAAAAAAAAACLLAAAPEAAASGLERAFLDSRAGPVLPAAHAPRWTTVREPVAREGFGPAAPVLIAAPAPAASRKIACKAGGKSLKFGKGEPCRVAAPVATAAAAAPTAAGDWRATLETLRARPPLEQVRAVDRAINALPYVSDSENWGQADRWETPREMFARGGDCEGFALTKYFSLRALGFEDAALRLAIVWDTQDREEHAILLVQADGQTWVLDNKADRPVRADDLAGRYQLIYYASDAGVRLPVMAEAARAERPRARIINGGRTLVLRVTPRNRRGAPGADPAIVAEAMPAGD